MSTSAPAWLNAVKLNEMPNFTGVMARPRLACGCWALNAAIARRRPAYPLDSRSWSQARDHALGVADQLAVRRGLALGVEVAVAHDVGLDPEQGRAAADDVLDDQHPLRAAEAAEGSLRGLVGPGDPAVHADVRDAVGVVDVEQRAREHGFGEVEAPAAVGGQRRLERREAAVVVEADAPGGVEPVPLAGHRHVLLAGQPQPDRSAGQRGAQGGDRGEPVRLHLLAAEAAAHAQALHGDPVAGQAEHVRGDLLGLGRVLGAGLHEHLAVLVDHRQRAVRLEVEVLLSGEVDLALEDVGRAGKPGGDVAAGQHRLQRPGSSRPRWPRPRSGARAAARTSTSTARAPRRAASRVSPSTQQTAWPWYLTSSGNSGSSCLMPASLTPGTSCRGEHADDAGDVVRRARVEAGDPRVGVRRLDRVGVQHVLAAGGRDRRCRARGRSRAGPRSRARRSSPTAAFSGRSLRVLKTTARWWRWDDSCREPSPASAASCRASRRGTPRWPAGRRSACPRRPGRARRPRSSRRSTAVPSSACSVAMARIGVAATPPRPIRARVTAPSAMSRAKATATLLMSSNGRLAILWNAVVVAAGAGTTTSVISSPGARTDSR